ncbi:hypothetical protein K449DRAFT_468079 [Hypoxylon sp. EC38]|nr:hypothetical protein K449DRAFT_468079 [Hypoxylon sp. EC38]
MSEWDFSRHHHIDLHLPRFIPYQTAKTPQDVNFNDMIRLSTSVPPSYLLSAPVYSTGRSNTGRFGFPLDNHTEDYMDMDMSKIISFPDPPRPPTPGPPPRPPPIPPRPPVPTPPPSPSSEEETKWLQKIVAKQLSILAVRLVDIWFALDMPVSLPYPPRPPTPGPRPGPVNPRPDVPTPPPSPHRSSEPLVYETSRNDSSSGIRGLDTAPFMRLFSEQLAFETRVFVLLKLTMSPYDSHKKANLDFQKELYDNKLTHGLENAGETKLHTFIYNVAPENESDPHMSDLGSCTVSESSSCRLLHDGAETLRKDPVQLQVSALKQLNKARPDLWDALEDSSPTIMTPAISGVYSTRASPMSRTKTGTYEISFKGRNDYPLYMRSSSRKSQRRVTMTIRSLGPHHIKRSYGSRISRDPSRRGK